MTLDDLSSGVYTSPDPYSPSPQTFRGPVGDAKMIVPWSALSSASFSPQKFMKAKLNARPETTTKFKKGKLGDYETLDTIPALGPSEALPPQKRQRPRAEQISDIVAGLLHGAGNEALDLATLPRKLAEMGEDYLPRGAAGALPDRAAVNSAVSGLERFLPLSGGARAQVLGGPQTSGGEKAAEFGAFAPYMAGGAIGPLRKLMGALFGASTLTN